MNKKLVGLFGIVLSVILLVYFESFVYRVLGLVIDVTKYSNMIQVLINLGIKLIMCFLVYLLFKKDFRSRRTREGFIKTLVVFCISLVGIVVGMYLFDYVVKFLGDIFNVSVLNNDFYNIFDKKLDFSLVVKIVTDYLITPYLYCSIIILSIDKLIRRESTTIIFSGVLASVIHALSLSGTLGYVIVNSLSTFLLFGSLTFLYKKNYSIWVIILLYSAYLISNVFIINYIGW